MAALSADIMLPTYGDAMPIDVPCNAAGTFFNGQCVFVDATSGKAVVTPGSADRFIGFSAKNQTTTAADQLIQVYVDGIFGVLVSGSNAADIGKTCCVDNSAITNNPSDLVVTTDITEAVSDRAIGTVLSFHSSRAWVKLSVFKPTYSTAAAAGFYTLADG